MTEPPRLALLGGTFDPIHYGHLDAADAVRQALAIDQVLLVPTSDPPHRPSQPHASAYHRFALAALAINDREGMQVTDLELSRTGRSYTIDTLEALHARGWEPWQLFFVLGADAFAEIATWYRFPAVLDAAHFVVVARPGTTIEAALARAPALAGRVRTPEALLRGVPGTGVFLVDARTRDVSSTAIRARIVAGQPIDDLVPTAAARHIRAHHLYGAVDELHGEDEHRSTGQGPRSVSPRTAGPRT
jgi:nicotinate-nucleotide adenylyltransferase